MDRYISVPNDITILNELDAHDASGALLPTTTLTFARFLKRIKSVAFQQNQADTYELGKYFDSLFSQLAEGKGVLRSDGEVHPKLMYAARFPQGLFSGLEITQLGPFQRAVIEATETPPPAVPATIPTLPPEHQEVAA